MKKIVLLMVLGFIPRLDLAAQSLVPTSSFIVNLDYATFRNDDQSGYLEVYHGFYPHLLTYHWADDKFRGGIVLTTRLTNNETEVVIVNESETLPISVTDTSDVAYRFPFITQAGYALPFGPYTLEVVATDSIDTSRRDEAIFQIQIEPLPDQLVSSDLELCSKIASSSVTDNPFYKNNLEVVPNPTLIFGPTAYPVVFHYLELYNLDPDATYEKKTVIVDGNDNVLKEASRKLQYGAVDVVDVGTLNMTSLASGKYAFRFMLLDQDTEEVIRKEKILFVYNPTIEAPQRTALAFETNVFEGMSEKELDEEFMRADYIATKEEKNMYKQLGSEVGKREFLANFWTEILKGRRGQPPIHRLEFMRRIKEANDEFTKFGKEGWKTDMGRVYVLFGKPDQRERRPQTSDTKPYEEWYYHGIEGGVMWVFVDRYGTGEYQQVFSTKRGEIYYDNWEDFLR